MTAARARPPHLVHRFVDPAAMGGVALLAFAVIRWVPGVATAGYQAPLVVALTWAVSYPHFVSTGHRLYGSVASIRQYPMTAVVTPLLFGGAIVGAFAAPATIAPALVKLYNSWSPFHFSGQTIGLVVLYARRAGVELERRERRLLTWFVLSTAVHFSARLESSRSELRFFGVAYPTLRLPAWTVAASRDAVWVLGALAASVVASRLLATRTRVPALVVLPVAAQYVWFATVPIVAYANLVPFFHSLEYLLVAWAFHRDAGARAAKPRGRAATAGLVAWVRWMAVNVAGGVLLFWLLPALGAGTGRTLGFSTAVILAGVQMHHFFVDGVIWRLHAPSVGDRLAPPADAAVDAAERSAIAAAR